MNWAGFGYSHQSARVVLTLGCAPQIFMTATRMLWLSLAGLTGATCGLAGLLIVAMKYFTYQGSGLGWIYPASGLLILLWCVSAFGVVSSGTTVIAGVIKRKAAQRRK